jgi:hypothetical protein
MQRMRVLIDARHESVQNPQHLLGERARRDDALLRPAQARGSDHLHRFGDLLRRFDGTDPAPEIDE